MSTNFVQPGKVIKLPTVTGAVSGDPCVLGDNLPLVLQGDAETTSPYNAECATQGVYDLSVKGHNGVTNVAVEQGDKVYFHADRTPKLDVDNTGKPYGIMVEATAIPSGTTATREVLLVPNMVEVSES